MLALFVLISIEIKESGAEGLVETSPNAAIITQLLALLAPVLDD